MQAATEVPLGKVGANLGRQILEQKGRKLELGRRKWKRSLGKEDHEDIQSNDNRGIVNKLAPMQISQPFT